MLKIAIRYESKLGTGRNGRSSAGRLNILQSSGIDFPVRIHINIVGEINDSATQEPWEFFSGCLDDWYFTIRQDGCPNQSSSAQWVVWGANFPNKEIIISPCFWFIAGENGISMSLGEDTPHAFGESCQLNQHQIDILETLLVICRQRALRKL